MFWVSFLNGMQRVLLFTDTEDVVLTAQQVSHSVPVTARQSQRVSHSVSQRVSHSVSVTECQSQRVVVCHGVTP